MNSENLQVFFKKHWHLLVQALPSFKRSLEKCRPFDFSSPISFETEESMDALSSKFARISDIYTQKVFKTAFVSSSGKCSDIHRPHESLRETRDHPQRRRTDRHPGSSQYHRPGISKRKPLGNIPRNNSSFGFFIEIYSSDRENVERQKLRMTNTREISEKLSALPRGAN